MAGHRMDLADRGAAPVHRVVEVRGRPMFYRTAGARGPSIVLVHGFVVSSSYMVPLMQALAGDHRVYAPDLPGFGRSYRPDETLAVDALAAALGDWLSAVGLDGVAMFANSFGCQIATALCASGPGRVDRLVLQGPTGDPEIRNGMALALRWLAALPQELADGMGGIIAAGYWTAGVRRTHQTMTYLLADRMVERLPAVCVPTLVIRGSRDPIVRRAWARDLAKRLPYGRYTEMPGSHSLNFSAPKPLAAMIRSFLREGGRRERAHA